MNKIHLHFLLILLLLFSMTASASQNCHPKINRQVENYVIGYGSLINEDSKRLTVTNVSDNIPTRVSGFERGWIHQINDVIYLGVTANKDSSFNGVIFHLTNPDEVVKFDQRETDYCRVKVAESQVTFFNQEKVVGDMWVYVSKNPIKPTTQAAVHLYYLYIFLSGCEEIEKKHNIKGFLDNCMKTTHSWPILIDHNLDSLKLRYNKNYDYTALNKIICNNQKVLDALSKKSTFYTKICATLD